MKPTKISEVTHLLETLAPASTAESWDNVGLLAGDPSWKTNGAVIAVDLTHEVIELAKKKKYKLIVNHHPAIFPKSRGLARVTPPHAIFEALRNGIAVISSHTNFDQCALEVVQKVSQGLGVTPKGRLLDKETGILTKLVVFVPETHAEAVRHAICEAGAGRIGNYDFCTFGTLGEGTFRGQSGTHPFMGKPGEMERAREIKLESIFPRGIQKRVLSALFNSHPYEEVAFDLIPLEQGPAQVGIHSGLGYGFWGDCKGGPKTFAELTKDVKRLFGVDGFWMTNPKLAAGGAKKLSGSSRKFKRIAFVAGKGSSFLDAAAAQGCDCFITGEAGYHVAIGGAHRGMAVIELGHRHSEKFFAETMSEWLKKAGLQTATVDTEMQTII